MMPLMQPRVHLAEQVPAEVERELAADFELVPSPVGADGILTMLTVTRRRRLSRGGGPQLRIVANYAVGVNNIDLEAARRRKSSSPTRPTSSPARRRSSPSR